jgi:hypothetical protein
MIDFSRVTSTTTIENTAEFVLQQIDILLDTDKGEVLGEPRFGSDYDKFLYELNISNTYIENYIYNNITENVDLMGWELSVHVDLMVGTKTDIILVEISVSKNNDVFSKVYKIDTSIIEPDKIMS